VNRGCLGSHFALSTRGISGYTFLDRRGDVFREGTL
jgi:hypothetical protein